MGQRLLALLPNLISTVRLILGLVFPWIPPVWRPLIVLLAALSDLLDGATSRWLHVEGKSGQILDPIADKVFILAVVATMVYEGQLGLADLACIGLRDLVVLLGTGWVLLRCDWSALQHMPPTYLGKLVTVLQFLFVLTLLLVGNTVLLIPTSLFSGLAALDYARRFWHKRN